MHVWQRERERESTRGYTDAHRKTHWHVVIELIQSEWWCDACVHSDFITLIKIYAICNDAVRNLSLRFGNIVPFCCAKIEFDESAK